MTMRWTGRFTRTTVDDAPWRGERRVGPVTRTARRSLDRASNRSVVTPAARPAVAPAACVARPSNTWGYRLFVQLRIAAEGIISLLGVPMLADDEVLGVIFTATRREYEFDIEEMALLTALANHASVVLQTARRLRKLRRAENESRKAVAQLSQTLRERDRAHAVHRQLMEAVLKGGGLDMVVEILSKELSRPIMLVDMEGSPVCRSGRWSETVGIEFAEASVSAALEKSAQTGSYVALEGEREIQGISVLEAGERRFAAILLGAGNFPLGDVDVRTVERAALVGALMFLSDEAVAAAEYRVQNDVVRDLLTPGTDRERVAEVARGRGIDVSAFDSLVLLTVSAEERDLALKTARVIAPEESYFKVSRQYCPRGREASTNVCRTNKGRLGSQSAHRLYLLSSADWRIIEGIHRRHTGGASPCWTRNP